MVIRSTDFLAREGCCIVPCTSQQWMQSHTASHLENKNRKGFSGDQGICTPPGVLFGVVLNVSSHLYNFCCGSDSMLKYTVFVSCRFVKIRLPIPFQWYLCHCNLHEYRVCQLRQ
jgi:hypothetical protein